jgi:hypothetical protein
MLHATCYMLHATCYMLHAICNISPLIRPSPIRYTLYAIRYLPPILYIPGEYAKIFAFLGARPLSIAAEDDHMGKYEGDMGVRVADKLRKVLCMGVWVYMDCNIELIWVCNIWVYGCKGDMGVRVAEKLRKVPEKLTV